MTAGLPAQTPLTRNSARVKRAQRLSRRADRAEHRMFLAEGLNALHEALQVSGCVVEVLATAAATSRYAELHDASITAGAEWLEVDDRAMATVSGTVTPPGVVGVCRFVDRPLVDLIAPESADTRAPGLVALLADVRDPGNAGTVIRCADAAGADAVVLTGTSVDPYNPKAVRASVGSLFHVPLAICADSTAALATLRGAGLRLLAAAGDGETDLDDAIDDGLLDGPTAWLFGNEAHGLPDDLAARADLRVRIPIHGRAESLNLSTAAAVCLYASARARRR